MESFGKWVEEQRTARKLSMTECARRAGMKLQAWNRLEKTVQRPREHTARAVALALVMPAEEVLRAAGYHTPVDANEGSIELAERLHRVLQGLPSTERRKVEGLLEQNASDYVNLLRPYLSDGDREASE